MNRILYSSLLYLLSPLLVLYLAMRAIKSPSYRGRWGERFGLSRLQSTDLLIHSVSMGETLAAIPLINKLMEKYPQLSVTVTTTSPTGSAEVTKAFGERVQHCYLPFDISWCVARFIKQVQPKQCIIMETELWPNLIYQAKRRGIKLMLANARLSEKSAKQYLQRPKLSTPMLQALDVIAAQSHQAAKRFIALGVEPDKVKVCGSLKFDLSIGQQHIDKAALLRSQWQRVDTPVWVAGSVHPGEFDIILASHKNLLIRFPEALLIMVPRHPEQFDVAANRIKAAGFNFARRSKGDEVSINTQVLLGDTMGELLSFYAAADQAFVGGTLITNGGHNPLEPAALGLPVYVGPNHRDFAEITQMLEQAGALSVVESSDDLVLQLVDKFDDNVAYLKTRQAGLKVVAENKGALAEQFKIASRLIEQ
ncbi:lipid IV(A) 3-deoxy-D-manno-octulosonic acid transferase [Shewanella psychrotolerans]|uniref:lipid IV(A) 3-deoxy-D-manno-octulosonic acid transferase n=1 Tax=Shewanella psychrotolerans TaxID=2864206 RepID=UPI001C656C71|nr:lipid IV(A) 3-deoxy-D-manno-octulosonic acid transferase [Shewanella psychrotolerans]QYK01307.1 lipid IV(A) 3-deoxy-D-manno-octulosonic acid transferase [Shewanella psychrotolerans]